MSLFRTLGVGTHVPMHDAVIWNALSPFEVLTGTMNNLFYKAYI